LAPIPAAATEIEEGSSVAGELTARFFCTMPGLRKLCVMAGLLPRLEAEFDFYAMK
jgi:hypothetical protein